MPSPEALTAAALLRAGGNPGKLYDEILAVYQTLAEVDAALCGCGRCVQHRLSTMKNERIREGQL